MKVSDILQFKGGTLFTASPDMPLSEAIQVMADRDIGSLVVMDQGKLTGYYNSLNAARARQAPLVKALNQATPAKP